MLVLSAGSVDPVDREPLLLCWERFSQTTSPTHRGLPHMEGLRGAGGVCSCQEPGAAVALGTGFGDRSAATVARCLGKKKGHLLAFRGSPLTDSNRRPPLYEEGPCVNWVGLCLSSQ